MSTDIAIGVTDGQVVLRFEESLSWIALDPENARLIGEAIAKAAYEARFGIKPAEGQSAITEAIRNKLMQRASLIINNLSNKPPLYVAGQVVDTVLAEIS